MAKLPTPVDPSIARQELAQRTSDVLDVLGAPVAAQLTTLSKLINAYMKAQGFWTSDNTGEKIALMHSELSEALEADRKGLMSDHIPGFTGVAEELADVMIRILDFAGHHKIDLGDALIEKMQFNITRPYKHGKAY